MDVYALHVVPSCSGRYLAELIRSTYKWATEAYSDAVLYAKVKLHDGCCLPSSRCRSTLRRVGVCVL